MRQTKTKGFKWELLKEKVLETNLFRAGEVGMYSPHIEVLRHGTLN